MLAENRHLALFAEAQRVAGIGCWEFDLNTGKVWCSDECCRLLDCQHEAYLQSYADFERCIHPEDRAELANRTARALAERTPYQAEVRVTLPDGGIRHLELRGRVQLDAEGTAKGVLGTVQDVTERKLAETACRRQISFLEAVLASMPLGVSVFDKELKLRLWNDAYVEALSLPHDQVFKGAAMEEILAIPASRGELGSGPIDEIVRQCTAEFLSFTPQHVERNRLNGRTQIVQIQPLHMERQVAGMIATYTDITERSQMEDRLLLADKVFANSPVGIIIADPEQKIMSVNPAFTSITGYERGESVGFVLGKLPQTQPILSALKQDGQWNGELHSRRKTGERISLWLNISSIRDAASHAISHYLWILLDNTERKRTEERINHLAHHDPLTGLPNRLSLMSRLEQALPESRRYGWHLALMFIDLDRFKDINDTLGHQVGDALLIEVARRLAVTLRDSDTVARIGGDEFVVVLPDAGSAANIAGIASKIIEVVGKPILIDHHELHTSPSIGISIFPDDGNNVEILMRNADTAMYHAKAAGRNTYQFYAEAMNRQANERLKIVSKLRQAIAREELRLHYQPQCNVRTGAPTGVEALLRWNTVDGAISPADFIPIAEETGLINSIGRWVLHEGCRQMKAWIDAGTPPLRLAINLSALQLRQKDFCRMVADILLETGLPACLLELELTESAVMEEPLEAIRILGELRQMGITLAIDDFGTGYSSLAYLKRLPISHLKIDRSFVADLETDLHDRAIAFSTIALAHSLGIKVIAEGVENANQLKLLRDNDCDEVQGYHYSGPLPAERIIKFFGAMAAKPERLPCLHGQGCTSRCIRGHSHA